MILLKYIKDKKMLQNYGIHSSLINYIHVAKKNNNELDVLNSNLFNGLHLKGTNSSSIILSWMPLE